MATQSWSGSTIEVVTQNYGEMMRDDVVKLKIGADHVEYFVHPGFLLQHSEYFRRLLNGNWKEVAEEAICLDDVDCKTFEIFLQWLYTQRYPTDDQFRAETPPGSTSGRAMQLARIKACEFGDRFMASGYLLASENALIDSLIVDTQIPFYDTIIYAFTHLRSDSPILQALIDSHCFCWHEQSDTEKNGELQLRSQLPHSFLLGVALRYMQTQDGQRRLLDRCDYHKHSTDNERGDNCTISCVDDFETSSAYGI
ncbi:hypothetical protein C7974DRAFT_373850 [Boeremia exigua]|uniref:uncharacterized protein n=1 Tax=Boeremia exigua TaxID=749465 RepID=UPI001E8D3408|nr:uncharacterized protein C7974DRAFT_373850 [Boeremia exigua]KAH6639640.1 hypothetical protein C7974DRAFT_373850 [Boeremia exigua]